MSEAVLEGMKGVLELATKGTTHLMDEALNLFIVLSVLDILKFGVVFVIFFVVKKYLGAISDASESDKTKRMVKSAQVAGFILSLVFFVGHSYGAVVNIAKIMVAPNIFLMEKGYKIVQDVKDGNMSKKGQ